MDRRNKSSAHNIYRLARGLWHMYDFATFFIAASWIVYALRDTAPLALARVYSRFRQYRKRINDEESWDRACPEALGDDSEEIFHIKGGH